jgi:hypothetical protein
VTVIRILRPDRSAYKRKVIAEAAAARLSLMTDCLMLLDSFHFAFRIAVLEERSLEPAQITV